MSREFFHQIAILELAYKKCQSTHFFTLVSKPFLYTNVSLPSALAHPCLVAAVFALQPCHSDFDCMLEMKMCIGGVCQYPGSYRAQLMAQCSNSKGCPRGKICVNRVCKSPRISPHYRWATVEEDASI
uniref:WAP domain-containing protein n=1 Tax=Ditylenchus dipsaci TaxID=166011 RepID=A0A915E6A4_9BILA